LTSNDSSPAREYFRRDQRDGVSPPDMSKDCTFAENIVHARGKRTQFTSVSLDLSKIRDFGDTNYKLERDKTVSDGHSVVEHEELLAELRRSIREAQREDSDRAARALVYATRRKEGLVNCAFNTSSLARKDLIAWALARVQDYFTRVG
jgi:hypothetical protein